MCRSDEPHLYPVRSFTYRNEQARVDEVQMEIMYSETLSLITWTPDNRDTDSLWNTWL
jgi:hypothetical protein